MKTKIAEEERSSQLKYYYANQEKAKERKRRNHFANKEVRNAQSRAYAKANPEVLRRAAAYLEIT